MKRIMPYVGKILFSLFMLGAIAFLLSLSWSALSKVFPDSVVNQAFGLIMFDVAALAWLMAFIYVAKGFQQRGLSLTMFVISLIGTLGLVGLEIAMSTGWVVYADVMTPLSILLTVIVAAHVTAIYFMHLFDPEVSAQIERQADIDGVLDQAQRDATAELDRLRPELAQSLAADYVAAAKRELGQAPIPVTPGDVFSPPVSPEKDFVAPALPEIRKHGNTPRPAVKKKAAAVAEADAGFHEVSPSDDSGGG